MESITFNEIPQVLMELNRKMDLLLTNKSTDPEFDKLMSLVEYQQYHFERTGKRIAKQTIYDQITKGKIPNEKHGKFVYFRKSTIDRWFDNGRQK